MFHAVTNWDSGVQNYGTNPWILGIGLKAMSLKGHFNLLKYSVLSKVVYHLV